MLRQRRFQNRCSHDEVEYNNMKTVQTTLFLVLAVFCYTAVAVVCYVQSESTCITIEDPNNPPNCIAVSPNCLGNPDCTSPLVGHSGLAKSEGVREVVRDAADGETGAVDYMVTNIECKYLCEIVKDCAKQTITVWTNGEKLNLSITGEDCTGMPHP